MQTAVTTTTTSTTTGPNISPTTTKYFLQQLLDRLSRIGYFFNHTMLKPSDIQHNPVLSSQRGTDPLEHAVLICLHVTHVGHTTNNHYLAHFRLHEELNTKLSPTGALTSFNKHYVGHCLCLGKGFSLKPEFSPYFFATIGAAIPRWTPQRFAPHTHGVLCCAYAGHIQSCKSDAVNNDTCRRLLAK